MVYDGVSKGVKDETVDEMVEDATSALEVVTDELWVLLVAHLIPNVACRVRETEENAHVEAKHKVQDEAEHLRWEKVTKAMWQEKWVDEKLTEFLEGWITQAQLEANLEVEQSMEAEESEAVETEDVRTTGGTQSSAMEVEEEEEDKVVIVEEVK